MCIREYVQVKAFMEEFLVILYFSIFTQSKSVFFKVVIYGAPTMR